MTPEAKDFIESLLKVNPDERISIDQALEHKWLKVMYANEEETNAMNEVNKNVDFTVPFEELKKVINLEYPVTDCCTGGGESLEQILKVFPKAQAFDYADSSKEVIERKYPHCSFKQLNMNSNTMSELS
jgi:serine/threonine protein kinase